MEKFAGHNHEIDDDYIPGGGRENYYKWTSDQTKKVMEGVMNKATPTVIRRNLKAHFGQGMVMPSGIQLVNKIAHL